MNSSYKFSQWLKNSFYWQLLPIITLNAYCEPEKMITTQDINLAVIKISGRQMTLCQRSALMALRLVCTANKLEQDKLIEELVAAIDLMEVSHSDLINGNVETPPSEAVLAIYFKAPLYLDGKIKEYISQVRTLVWQAKSSSKLTLENTHLQAILNSEAGLNEALEVLVNQSQKESEAIVQYLEKQQIEITYKSCASAAAAYVYAQQREQTLQDLRGMQAQLIQMEKLASIGKMLAGVAHEINNPVSFICGNLCYASDYIQDLLELLNLYQQYYQEPIPIVQAKIKEIDLDFLRQDLPKVLSSMEVGADRVRQIVISLRNFSRQDQTFLQSVDLHEGIDNTLLILQNSLKVRCHRPAIEVIKEYGNLPTLECCPGQLNQVFMNLLNNAIDAINDLAEHQGCITIRTAINADYSGIIIQIADNGCGMTTEAHSQLFTPFFTTKPLGKGTGLGLSISRQIIVEIHGGSLECESKLGQGTKFKIEIPLQPSHQNSLQLTTNHVSKNESEQTPVRLSQFSTLT